MIAYVLMFVCYFSWRLTVLDPHSITVSIAFLLAECMGFGLCLTTLLTSWRYQHHDAMPPLPNRTVDVLIPTYKEPIYVIRRTLIAAKAIAYPHNVFVLDDGRREDVRALAEEFGLPYYSREKNTHAKAGNLNFGLGFSQAEFVFVLDADHIAKPDAIDLLIGHFADPRVAMVQAPQDYYNTDGFQFVSTQDGRLWDEQSFFFNVSQPCRDAGNGASSVGTGMLLRRDVMDEIGGFPTETVTEDVHASLRMHKAGYRVLYVNEPIAYGVAAHDLGEYYKTRHRWAHGNIHALRCEKLLTCEGLTLRQRLAYLYLGLVYLEGWQQLILFLIPIAALLFGLQPFEVTIFNVAVILLYTLVNAVMLQELGCGFSRFWASEIFTMARWPVYIAAARGFFGLPIRWRSSSKKARKRFNWGLAAPQLSIMLLSAVGLLVGLVRVHDHTELSPILSSIKQILTGSSTQDIQWFAVIKQGYTLDIVVLAGIWAMLNIVRVAAFLRKALRHTHHTHEFFRFAVSVPVALTESSTPTGYSIAVSETWMKLRVSDTPSIKVGDIIQLMLSMPSGALQLQLSVTATSSIKGETEIEGELLWQGEKIRDALASDLYAVEWHRPIHKRFPYFSTPLDMFLRIPKPSRHNQSCSKWIKLLKR